MTLAETYDAARAKCTALGMLVEDLHRVDVGRDINDALRTAVLDVEAAARAEWHAAIMAAEEAHEAFESAPKCRGCGEPIEEHDAAETQGCAAFVAEQAGDPRGEWDAPGLQS